MECSYCARTIDFGPYLVHAGPGAWHVGCWPERPGVTPTHALRVPARDVGTLFHQRIEEAQRALEAEQLRQLERDVSHSVFQALLNTSRIPYPEPPPSPARLSAIYNGNRVPAGVANGYVSTYGVDWAQMASRVMAFPRGTTPRQRARTVNFSYAPGEVRNILRNSNVRAEEQLAAKRARCAARREEKRVARLAAKGAL